MTQIVVLRCLSWGIGLIFVSVASGNTLTGKLELIRKIPRSGYSEGLDFHDGFLWNALPKEIRKINPKDGDVVEKIKPATEYSESISWFQGKLWNVSFTDNSIHAGKYVNGKMVFEKKGTVPEVHAWGLTDNKKNLVVTGDYSSKLYFLDPKTLKVVKTLETDAKDLEDLAWDGNYFWTSSFTQTPGHIYAIDPKTGKRKALFSLPHPEECPIIDGIAIEKQGLWITGKECPSFYYCKIPKI